LKTQSPGTNLCEGRYKITEHLENATTSKEQKGEETAQKRKKRNERNREDGTLEESNMQENTGPPRKKKTKETRSTYTLRIPMKQYAKTARRNCEEIRNTIPNAPRSMGGKLTRTYKSHHIETKQDRILRGGLSTANTTNKSAKKKRRIRFMTILTRKKEKEKELRTGKRKTN